MYQMKCIAHAFCRSKDTHAHTHAHKGSMIFDMCGMIHFARDVIWICKTRFNTQIPIVLFKHQISNFGAIMPPVHPSVNTYHTQIIPNDFG